MVVVLHGDRTRALYGHIKKGSARVMKGDTVRVGQPLAECGFSNGAHLHFEVEL